jgi:ABC-2 type transport system permease protein
VQGGSGTAGTLALLGAVLAAYVVLWVAACAFVATLWRGAVASLSILVLAWTLFTVAVPGAASIAADLLVEKPSRIAAIDASRRAQDAFYNGSEGPRLTSEWLARIPGGEARADLRDAPEVKRLARDAYYDTQLDIHRAAFRAYERDVAAASRWLALVSPATAFDLALQSAAGTDAARHAEFLAAAASYRATLRRFFEPRIVAQVLHPVPVCAGCQGRLDFDAYDSVPRFEASKEQEAGQEQALAALILFLALGLSLSVAARLRLKAWPV